MGIILPQDSETEEYEIEGVSDPDKIQCDLASQCNENFNIPIRPIKTDKYLCKINYIAIAEVLHETGFAETKRSGIRVMLESMLEANLSFPLFDSDRDRDRFQVTLYSHNLFDDKALQWLSQFKEHNLTDEEAKILVVLKEKGVINNAVCRIVNDIDTLKASQMLKRLRDIGLIDIHGKSTATRYTLKSQFLEETNFFNLDSSSTEKHLSGQLSWLMRIEFFYEQQEIPVAVSAIDTHPKSCRQEQDIINITVGKISINFKSLYFEK